MFKKIRTDGIGTWQTRGASAEGPARRKSQSCYFISNVLFIPAQGVIFTRYCHYSTVLYHVVYVVADVILELRVPGAASSFPVLHPRLWGE